MNVPDERGLKLERVRALRDDDKRKGDMNVPGERGLKLDRRRHLHERPPLVMAR